MSGLFKGPSMTTRAEKIASFQSTTCEWGTPLGIAYGTCKLAPNLINWQDFTTIENVTTTKTGKHSKSTTIDYDYWVYTELALCEGPIDGLGKIWAGNDEYETLASFNAANAVVGAPLNLNVGNNPNPTAYMQSKHPEVAVGYKDMAYLYGYVFLGTNTASIPSYNIEVKGQLRLTGDGVDANPADVIIDLLSRAGYATYIDTDSFDNFRSYCRGMDLLISTPSDEFSNQKKCQEYVQELLDLTNAYLFLSVDKIKIVPRDDRQRGSWKPNNTVRFNITPDDMQEQQDGTCVSFSRKDSSEVYNRWGVSYTSRENGYEEETVFYQDVADMEKHGIRSAPIYSAKWLHTAERAVKVAEMRARINRTEFVKYTFKLDWKFCVLEPGDLITLTDNAIGLENQLCMVQSITEDAAGLLSVVALRRENMVDDISFDIPKHAYNSMNYNKPPGNIRPPLMITPPADLVTAASGVEVWIALQGQTEHWGGCDVYASTKDGSYTFYEKQGNNSNMGYLLTPMGVDSTSVDVRFTNVGVVSILEGSVEDADNDLTNFWINGECLAYTGSELIAENTYRLSGLVRGKYNTKVTTHSVNDGFAILDGNLFCVQLTKNYLGKMLYFKFPSFNTLKKNTQALNDVDYYSHAVMLYDIPNVSDVSATATKVSHTNNYYDDDDYTLSVTYTWNVNVTWKAPDWPDYSSARVSYRKGSGAWRYAGVGVNALSINGIDSAGDYTFAVSTKDTNGNYETEDDSSQVTITLS